MDHMHRWRCHRSRGPGGGIGGHGRRSHRSRGAGGGGGGTVEGVAAFGGLSGVTGGTLGPGAEGGCGAVAWRGCGTLGVRPTSHHVHGPLVGEGRAWEPFQDTTAIPPWKTTRADWGAPTMRCMSAWDMPEGAPYTRRLRCFGRGTAGAGGVAAGGGGARTGGGRSQLGVAVGPEPTRVAGTDRA